MYTDIVTTEKKMFYFILELFKSIFETFEKFHVKIHTVLWNSFIFTRAELFRRKLSSEIFSLKLKLQVIEHLSIERSSGGHLVHPSAQARANFKNQITQGLVSIKFVKSAKFLLWAICSSAHGKELLCIPIWNFPCSYLWPWPLVLSHCTSKKNLALTSPRATTDNWRPLSLCFHRINKPGSLSILSLLACVQLLIQ